MNTITTAIVGDLATLIHSFKRSFRVTSESPKTIANYGEATTKPVGSLWETGMPVEVSRIDRENFEKFKNRLVATSVPATVRSDEPHRS